MEYTTIQTLSSVVARCSGTTFPFIASERDIFLVDIPAAGFQFLNQPAFRHFPVPDQPVISHIIRTAL